MSAPLTFKQRIENYMRDFDPDRDYKPVHLEWLDRHKDFNGHGTYKSQIFATEYDYYSHLYKDKGHMIPNKTVYIWYNEHITQSERQRQMREYEKARVKSYLQIPTENNRWFVTLSFCADNYSDEVAIGCLNKFFTYDWVAACEAVFEWHTESGWRPHLMMRLETPPEYTTSRGKKEKLTKSVLIRYIFKSAGWHRTGLVMKDNFVKVDPWREGDHIKYIMLDKCDDKVEYIQSDHQYRMANSIQERYIK